MHHENGQVNASINILGLYNIVYFKTISLFPAKLVRRVSIYEICEIDFL